MTRAEIEEIRGVAVSRGTVDQLLELDWIRLGRRRMTPGRPVTFVVTEAFLDHFGLESARDLPGLKELRAAGLLDNRPPPGQGCRATTRTTKPSPGKASFSRIEGAAMDLNRLLWHVDAHGHPQVRRMRGSMRRPKAASPPLR